MRRLAVPILVLAILVAGALIMSQTFPSLPFLVPEPEGPLNYVRYSLGGGMQGGHSSIELKLDEDGSPVVVTESQEWHNSRCTTTVYAAPIDAFSQVHDLAVEHNLARAATRGESDLFPLDADLWSLRFGYEENGFTIGELQEISEKEREGVNAVVSLMRSWCTGEPISSELSPLELRLTTPEGFNIFFKLDESTGAASLIDQLPMDAKLETYGDNELIFYPPEKLELGDDTPLAPGGGAGTLAYFEPWGDVVIFIGDYEPYPGLYLLGSFEAWEAPYLAEHAGKDCTLYLDTMLDD